MTAKRARLPDEDVDEQVWVDGQAATPPQRQAAACCTVVWTAVTLTGAVTLTIVLVLLLIGVAQPNVVGNLSQPTSTPPSAPPLIAFPPSTNPELPMPSLSPSPSSPEPGAPPPPRLLVRGTRLEWAGSPIFLSGVNHPWYSYGHDFGGRGLEHACHMRQVLINTSRAGGNSIRVWVHADSAWTPKFHVMAGDDHGFVYATDSKQSLIEDLRRYLRWAQELNLLVVLCLWNGAVLPNTAGEYGKLRAPHSGPGQRPAELQIQSCT